MQTDVVISEFNCSFILTYSHLTLANRSTVKMGRTDNKLYFKNKTQNNNAHV